MDFVNRLVERTRSADRTTVRPVVGPGLAGTSAREPLLVVDELREIASSHTPTESTAAAAIAAPGPSARPPRDIARPDREPYERLTTLVALESTEPPDVEAAAPTIGSPSLASPLPLEGERASAPALAPPVSVLAPAPTPASARAVAVTSTPRTARNAAARSESHTGDQVIRVHIGRIDVRAPAPVAAPAVKRTAEALPSVALGRYLDDRGRRR